MNLFLAKKINPSKSKLAKIFAIFLVCFFVGGIKTQAFVSADPIPTEATPSTTDSADMNAGIAIPSWMKGFEVTQTAITQNRVIDVLPDRWWNNLPDSVDQTKVNSLTYKDPTDNSVYKVITVTKTDGLDYTKRYTYKLDPVTGEETRVANPSSFPNGATELRIDPVSINSDPNSPLKYDYADGRYVYTDENGNITRLSPVGIEKEVQKLVEANTANSDKLAEARTNAWRNTTEGITNSAATIAKGGNSNSDPKQKPSTDMKCDWKEFDCLFAKAIYTLTIGPAGLILGASGWLMAKTFEVTVVNLAETLGKNGSFYSIIKLVWGMFRDIINMTFIFLLLYASIMTILKADTSRIKKMVGNVVLVAMLINFSLFFTTAIIDTSNVLAVGIYNQINQGASPENNNLAAAFMSKLKMDTLLTDAKAAVGTNKAYGKMITICIFGSIFILVLAVMFFVISILFIVRFATLLMLMMMSPLGIGSIAIPKLEKAFQGGFWNDLLSQCFFAPIMILFLWISIKMLDGIVALGGQRGSIASTLTDPAAAKAGLGAFILGFVVLIIILIKGIEFSKSLSAKGAGAIQSGLLKVSGADKLQNYMKNAPRAVGGATARNTVGWGANRLADNKTFRNWAANNAVARTAFKATQGVADAKFGGKKGYVGNKLEGIKQREAFAKSLMAPTLKEALDKEKLDKANSILAAKHIEETKAENTTHEQRKKELEESIRLDGERSKKIEDELKTAKEELEAKRVASGMGSHFSDSVLEDKIAKLQDDKSKLGATTEKEELENVENKIVENNNKLAEELKKLDVKYDDKKPDESIAKIQKDADKIRKEDKSYQDKSIAELRKITEGLKVSADAGKERMKVYTENLAKSRVFNLGIPSRTSQQAALNLRKEINKSTTEKEKDKLVGELKKLVGEGDKPKEAEKPKDSKK